MATYIGLSHVVCQASQVIEVNDGCSIALNTFRN